jgi:hypothetical protein
LRGNYLVSNWIGSDPERVADYTRIASELLAS